MDRTRFVRKPQRVRDDGDRQRSDNHRLRLRPLGFCQHRFFQRRRSTSAHPAPGRPAISTPDGRAPAPPPAITSACRTPLPPSTIWWISQTAQRLPFTPAYKSNSVPFSNASIVPQTRIHALANALAACANPTTGTGANCSSLFGSVTGCADGYAAGGMGHCSSSGQQRQCNRRPGRGQHSLPAVASHRGFIPDQRLVFGHHLSGWGTG